LLGERHGDNQQVLALAGDLGLATRLITLRTNALRELPNDVIGASLVTLRQRPALDPPWPDAVIAIGRRSVPIARWIKQRSGGRARLIHLGRPRAALGHFDLVITTAQYALPDAPNLARLTLPWQQSLASPPARGPGAHVLAILGGRSWSVSLTRGSVERLAAVASERAARLGLPLVATSGPRTPPDLAAHFGRCLGDGARLYDWRRAGGRDNPYRADLRGAAEVVLTGDSVSALADAAWTDRPVTVIAARERAWLAFVSRAGGPAATRWRRRCGNWSFAAPPPDVNAVLDELVRTGLARRREGGVLTLAPCRTRLEAERRALLPRVRALCSEGAGSTA
jgi:mitochondrial fission protein ELM1